MTFGRNLFILCALFAVGAQAACDCTPDPGCFVVTCPTLSISSHPSAVILFGDVDISSSSSNPSFPSLVKITGGLTMTMNSAVTAFAFPNLLWIGEPNASLGNLYLSGNSKLQTVQMPRLTDIYGRYFVSGNPNLTTIDFGLLKNVQTNVLVHSNTAVCDFCTLCGLAAAKPALTSSPNSSTPLYPWSSFSSRCALTPTSNVTGCSACFSVPPVPPVPGCSPTPSAPPLSGCLAESNVTFHYNPVCGTNVTLPDIGNSGLNSTDLFTSSPSYGSWGNYPKMCTYFQTQAPWFSSSSDRTFAKALTNGGQSAGMTVMFWLRTPGSTANFQMLASTRLTNNAATPQIEGSLKGWNIYINTNYSTNPAWYSEGNGPYLGWLSFWWSQCGNVTALSNPITHGWRKFHILNLNSNSTDLNKFMHIGIVYDNINKIVTAYKNGLPIASQSGASMGYWPKICAINNTDVMSGAPALRFGQNNENGLHPANVALGDIRIYDYVATAEIASASNMCTAG
jgi:hypothetical protein